jgi:hypothetical protein
VRDKLVPLRFRILDARLESHTQIMRRIASLSGSSTFCWGMHSGKVAITIPPTELMRRGTQELETQLGWGHPTYVQVLRQYSVFLDQTGHSTEAKDIAARVATLKRSPGFAQMASNHPSIGLDRLH